MNNGLVMSRIPEPMQDKENQGHYKDVFDTPNLTDIFSSYKLENVVFITVCF